MENKQSLTEMLKVLETEASDAKVELRTISSKLETAYDYEDGLMIRQENARKHTKELRLELVKKHQEISQIFEKMKNNLSLFTGNFYSH